MISKVKKTKNTSFYSIVLVLLLAILCIAVYTASLTRVLTQSVLSEAVSENSARTDAMHEVMNNFLDRQDFEDINDSSDKETELYTNLQSHLKEIRELNSSRYFYTAKKNEDGTLVYVVDGLDQDTDDFRNPGDPIEDEMIPYIERALSGETVYSQDIIDTTWGHIFTACYPITANDGSGEIVGALCIENDMESTYSFVAENKKILIRASIIVILVITTMLGCAYIFIRYYKKRREAEEQSLYESYQKLESVLYRERKHAEIISALSTIYTTIIQGNLKEHTYELIESSSLMSDITGKNGKLEDGIEQILNTFVDESMKKEMREFLNLDTLAERLQDTNTIMREYRNPQGRWYQARFIVKKRDKETNEVKDVLYVARDFTDEKKRELDLQEKLQKSLVEAKAANDSKTTFLRKMSHDIRTPLNGIVGMMRIMRKNEDDIEKRHECEDKILHSIDYLTDLVNNVLDTRKIESGSIVLEHKPFDLIELLLKTLPTVESNATEAGIIFKGGVETSHIQHRYVIGSPLHVARILMNIASNAIKYNRKGGMVELSCNEITSDGNYATYLFVCSDSGQGMSEEFQKHAFEPYMQEGKQTTTSISGSGLGLSIVKDFIDMMGGTIELISKENVGTTFKITLTFELDQSYKSHTVEAYKSVDLSNKKALLVEDNELNLEIAQTLLEEEGIIVDRAMNGQEALDKFKRSSIYSYDYIFMDMMMPVMDGLEATRRIRALDREDAKRVPIIAMTANAFLEDKQACLEAGMNAHVSKPIDVDQLKKTIVDLS